VRSNRDILQLGRGMMTNILSAELDEILEQTEPLWEQLRGERIFITGGTGFLGTWLLESFLHANRRLNLKAQASVLTRNPQAFEKRAPHLVADSIMFCPGSLDNFSAPPGNFAAVVHAAANVRSRSSALPTTPLSSWETLVTGTERVLEAASRMGAQKLLLTSSGAVYGTQPSSLRLMPETYQGAPDVTQVSSVYGEGKRAAEMLCVVFGATFGVQCKIARIFACVGPWQPIDSYFAIGNFIRDVLDGQLPCISGNGRPYRSYLYATDAAVWLWTILFRGLANEPYNVGSEREITIAQTAKLVARCGGLDPDLISISCHETNFGPSPRYVPDTSKARISLGLTQRVPLEEAILRTLEWHRRACGKKNRTPFRLYARSGPV
jgi:nucleoside-diphosphate-sugar epimerase